MDSIILLPITTGGLNHGYDNSCMASVYYLVEMATSTLHFKSSTVGRRGSFWEVAVSRAARLKIQREAENIIHEWHANAIAAALFKYSWTRLRRHLAPVLMITNHNNDQRGHSENVKGLYLFIVREFCCLMKGHKNTNVCKSV